MLIIQGYYFNGQNAQRVNASIQSLNGTGLSLVIDDASVQPLLLDYSDIHIEAPLGNTPRELELGEDRLFVSEDNEGIEQLGLLMQKRHFPFSLIHKLEKNLAVITLFSLFLIAFSWAIIVHGIPKAAKIIAFEMPEYIEEQLATSLDILDNTLLEPSELSSDRQAELRSTFSKYIALDKELNTQVHFRSGMAANALALPNGDIVFTDDLVNLVESDQELVAVLFHELGHVKNKHITRRILQDSMITVVVILLTGDIDTVDMVTGIPTLVLDLAYSRDFELEADRYAINRLKESNIPVETFSIMIKHLVEHYDKDVLNDDSSTISDFLSTHPHPKDRIQQVEQYK